MISFDFVKRDGEGVSKTGKILIKTFTLKGKKNYETEFEFTIIRFLEHVIFCIGM